MTGKTKSNAFSLSRRSVLAGTASLPLAATASSRASALKRPAAALFEPAEGVYLDSGTMHPVPRAAHAAVRAYHDTRASGARWPTGEVEERVKRSFATLVGASPEELAFVQSTTAGEQLVIDALGIPESGGRIVTDTLHFFGSFWMYQELERRGMEVVWLKPENGRIDPAAYEAAITEDTRLVSLSLVSTYNGFEHDLAAITQIAHARGAMVYADIIHAAGTVPVDLHASKVDFAATATYKWLMGDFGLGFLYVRADRIPELHRTRYGYYQLAKFQSHVYPFDPPGETVADMAPREDAEGLFAMGTRSHAVMAQLDASLPLLLDLGVDTIVARRRPLLERLHEALPAKGYRVVTPPECRSPLLTCAFEGAYERLSKPLADAGVAITLSRNRFRVCPSFFNTAEDIEALLAALPNQNG
ncbi:aminotransferase class V-fold PLP-dependent enzyme [Alteriqipengyuania sp. 357]